MKFSKDFTDVCKVVGMTSLGIASMAFCMVAGYVSPQDMADLVIVGMLLGGATGSYTATVGREAFQKFKRNGCPIRHIPPGRLHLYY